MSFYRIFKYYPKPTFLEIKDLYLAYRWLAANDYDVRIAAGTMFRLNRWARILDRFSRNRNIIYDLKNCFVRYLYEHDYCISVTQQIQKKYCWSCDGTGDYWGKGDCYKCDGTGIYSRYSLYKFVFQVRNCRYIWHQPETLVNWPVELTTDEMGSYQPNDGYSYGREAYLTDDFERLYISVLYLFLRRNGFEFSFSPVGLGARENWQYGQERRRLRNFKHKILDTKQNLGRLVEFARTGSLPPQDEIPF